MKAIKTKETPLKDTIIQYVGEKLQPENDEVTYDMVASVLAEEFPELMVLIAEENYIRGYQQAIKETEEFERTYEEFFGIKSEE